MRKAVALATVTAVLCACGGPIGPVPGAKLDGELVVWPTDWSFTDEHENVLLETNPTDPYSVTMWGVSLDQDFFIAASDPQARWVTFIAQDNRIVLSVAGQLYAGRADLVVDSAIINRIGDRYGSKYGLDEEQAQQFAADGGLIYRLTSR
jgi:hypothetical protein